jgi:hypothetical protein
MKANKFISDNLSSQRSNECHGLNIYLKEECVRISTNTRWTKLLCLGTDKKKYRSRQCSV